MKYAIIALCTLIIILAGCAPQETMTGETEIPSEETGAIREESIQGQPQEVKPLEPVEIREYNGERLDRATDVRDVSIKGPQKIDIEEYRLEVTGLVEEPKSYTYEEVLSHQKYSKVVEIHCVMGWNAKVLWEGILLNDLFEEVKPLPQANTVIFHAADGYTTSLSLQYIKDNNIMIADRINNVALPPAQGFPFMLVAEDKAGYKWAKWITKIELSDDPNYRGYWESRGYSIEGEIR